MPDFLLLMHDDVQSDVVGWELYFARLRANGVFQGGSAIGAGLCARRDGEARPVTARLTGYIRVSAESLEAAQELLFGNPVFEAGGTVEIRALPVTG